MQLYIEFSLLCSCLDMKGLRKENWKWTELYIRWEALHDGPLYHSKWQAKHMVLNIYLFSTLLTFSLLTPYQFCRKKYLCVHQHNCLSFFSTYLSCSLNLFWHVLPLLNSSGLKVSFCFSIWILRRQQDRCVLRKNARVRKG